MTQKCFFSKTITQLLIEKKNSFNHLKKKNVLQQSFRNKIACAAKFNFNRHNIYQVRSTLFTKHQKIKLLSNVLPLL